MEKIKIKIMERNSEIMTMDLHTLLVLDNLWICVNISNYFKVDWILK